MSGLTHLGQYWSSTHREIRLLGCADVGVGPDGRLVGSSVDLDGVLPLPDFRRQFRAALGGRRWSEVRWAYSALPTPAVELVEYAESSGLDLVAWARGLSAASGAPARALAELDVTPDAAVDHLVAPIIPRRAQGFGVTYLNSALERETEGRRGDYAYVYRAVKERSERPEIFLKGTSSEHFVGPRGRMGLRRDLTNSEALDGTASERVVVAAGIEPELAAVVYSSGKIWGYTLANDVSGNRLENETLLYLAQAKHFTGSLVLGPLIWLSEEQGNPALDLRVRVFAADGEQLFEHETNTSRISARLGKLVEWAGSHVRLQPGEVFSTGTDCVPDGAVKVLQPGHEVEIAAPKIGVLRHGAAVIPEAESLRDENHLTNELNPNYSHLEFAGKNTRV